MNKNDEQILCVERMKLHPFLRQGFYQLNESNALLTRIHSEIKTIRRGDAERDPYHKQIIPYCIVRHENKILGYKRLRGGGEERLHDKYAIGFGGHLNAYDCGYGDIGGFLWSGMLRELQEEIKVSAIKSIQHIGFINDDSNEVGFVHFGVVYIADVISEEFAVKEPDKIEAQWWHDPYELGGELEVETWSKLIIEGGVLT